MNLVEALLAASLLLTLSVAQHHAARTTSQAWHTARQQQAAHALLRRIDHLACQETTTHRFTLSSSGQSSTGQSRTAKSHEVHCTTATGTTATGDKPQRCTITPNIAGFKKRIVFCAHF